MVTSSAIVGILIAVTPILQAGSTLHKKYEPGELARRLRDFNVTSWEAPFFVYWAAKASDLITGYKEIFLFKRYYGLFGLPEHLVTGFEACANMNETLALDDSPEDDVVCLMEALSRKELWFPRTRYEKASSLAPGGVSFPEFYEFLQKLPHCYSSEHLDQPNCYHREAVTSPKGPSEYYVTAVLCTIFVIAVILNIYFMMRLMQPPRISMSRTDDIAISNVE